jgi:membrane protein DedA with SNARE-associated domain
MEWLTSFIQHYESLVYLIVFLAIIAEGDISLLLFGVLSRERVLSFFKILPIIIIAAIVHDIIFWSIGSKISRMKKKRYLFINFEKMGDFLDKIKPSIGIYVLLSKFAWNFNRIVIISSGYIRMPLKKFVKYSALSACLWSVTYMSLGYVFADQTDIFRQKLEVAGALVIGVIVLMALFEIYIKKILKKYFFGDNGFAASVQQKDKNDSDS